MAVNDIINILTKQNDIYKILVSLSLKMNAAIAENDLKKIDALIQEEIAYTMGFTVLEKKRICLINKYAEAVSFKGDDFNISVLKRYSDSNQIIALSRIEESLKETLAQLSQANSLNQLLIKKRLDYIDFSLKLLEKEDHKVYQTQQMEKKSKLIDELI